MARKPAHSSPASSTSSTPAVRGGAPGGHTPALRGRGNGKAGARASVSRARVKFDEIDLAILDQLQRDSKITNAMLAQQVGISPPSTLERVRKLENEGIIRGYVALLDAAAVSKGIVSIVHVTLRNHGKHELEEFRAEAAGFDEVQACWQTTGDEDFILKVVVTDMAQYEEFIVDRLSAIPNIGRVRSNFCLGTIKDTTYVPLDSVANGHTD